MHSAARKQQMMPAVPKYNDRAHAVWPGDRLGNSPLTHVLRCLCLGLYSGIPISWCQLLGKPVSYSYLSEPTLPLNSTAHRTKSLRHLNYSHLLYFWTVSREGSIAKAADVLHLTPQTISGQLKLLDDAVGERLFTRAGRRLVPSEMGRLVFQYADEIFTVGAELAQVVRGRQPGSPKQLSVGVTDSLPKLIAYKMLEPAMTMSNPVRIVCREGSLDALLADLALHRLDLVLADRAIPPGLGVKAFNHALGSSGVSLFATADLAEGLKSGFPESLHDAPMLLPTPSSSLRRALGEWFDALNITPRIVAEFDDSALSKVFGLAGRGVFAAPTAIENEVVRMYQVQLVGRCSTVREQFYAISPERKLRHPAVVMICEQARAALNLDSRS